MEVHAETQIEHAFDRRVDNDLSLDDRQARPYDAICAVALNRRLKLPLKIFS